MQINKLPILTESLVAVKAGPLSLYKHPANTYPLNRSFLVSLLCFLSIQNDIQVDLSPTLGKCYVA